MKYYYEYCSLIGDVAIVSDGEKVCDVVFKNDANYKQRIPNERINEASEEIALMKKWLDLHFIGIEPDFEPPYDYSGVK